MKVVKTAKKTSLALIGLLAAGAASVSAHATPVADSFYVNGNLGYALGYADARHTATTGVRTSGGDLATRGTALGLAFGYFPEFTSTHTMGLGLEVNATHMNQKGKQIFDDLRIMSMKGKNAFGAMVVGKYSFTPGSAVLVKAGWSWSKWNARTLVDPILVSSSRTLDGLKLGVGSEFFLSEDLAITLGVSYTLYREATFNHPVGNAMNKFHFKPRVLETNIGLSYFF